MTAFPAVSANASRTPGPKLLLRDRFFSTYRPDVSPLCMELTSAVTFSLSFGALVDGICAIDWRDLGLFGLVTDGPMLCWKDLKSN